MLYSIVSTENYNCSFNVEASMPPNTPEIHYVIYISDHVRHETAKKIYKEGDYCTAVNEFNMICESLKFLYEGENELSYI